MKNYLKKISSVILAFAMLMPALKIIEQQAFAGDFDTSMAVSLKINQLPSWCWITSGQMMLRTKLKKAGKLGDDEYINEKYGELCIEEVNKYYKKKVDQEQESGEGTYWWNLKSLEEFEELYENKFLDKYKVPSVDQQTSDINKETAFLVYLCSDRFYRPNANPNNMLSEDSLFSNGGDEEIGFVINNVLKAVGLDDVCYFYGSTNLNVESFRTTVTVEAVKNDSPVVAGNNGHYKVLLGISNNKVLVQETGGQDIQYEDSTYLKGQNGLFFISKPITKDFEQPIYKIELDKNLDDDKAKYSKGDIIKLAVNTNKQRIKLVNKQDKSVVVATAFSGAESDNLAFVQYIGLDIEDGWRDEGLYSVRVEMPVFEFKVPENGMMLKEFIENYEIDEDYYNLMFNGNGANGKVYAIGAEPGETVIIPDGDELTLKGFKFICWNTKKDGTGIPYSPGDKFTVTEDTTLYAIWSDLSKPQHTLTFDANGGSGDVPSSISTEAGIKVPISGGNGLTLDGFNFECWNTKQDGKGDTVKPGDTFAVTEDTTLYAIWSEQQYSGGGSSFGGGSSSGSGSFSGGGNSSGSGGSTSGGSGSSSTNNQPSVIKEESVADVVTKDVIAKTDYIYPSNNNAVVNDEHFKKLLTSTDKNEKLIITTGKTATNNSDVATVKVEDVDAVWTIKSGDVTEDYKKYYEWKQKYGDEVEQLNKKISEVADEKEKAILEEQKRNLLNKNESKNVYDCKFNMASSEIAAATNLPDEVEIVLSAAKNTLNKAALPSVISKSSSATISSIQDLLNKSVLVDFSKNGLFPGMTSVDVNLNKYKKSSGEPTKYFAFQVYKQNGNTIIDVIKGEDKQPKVVELSKYGYLRFTSNCGASYILVPEEYLNGISGATALETELQKSISQPVVLPMNPPAAIKVQ